MDLTAAALQEFAGDAGLDPSSLVVAPLDGDGHGATFDPGAALYPASMIKVPLAAAVLTSLADRPGQVSLETALEVGAANMTANDAESPLQPGYVATLRELMHRAISRSDNVATNVLFDVIGREHATEIAHQRLGLRATAFHRKLSGSEPLIEDPAWDGVHRNAHPAADAALLFAAIAGDRVPYAPLLRHMLAAQRWNEKLSPGLRDGDSFLHKTGDTDEVTHDGGILITREGRRYVVVVYSGLPSSPQHNARFGRFMRRVRELL
ncbi:MAG: serine hydrolase [Candidatus Tumulicola sp.]